MPLLHFQPIQDKTVDIIDAILQTEEVASLEEELNVIRLVVEELVVNVVDYSGSTYLDVELKRDENSITLQFRELKDVVMRYQSDVIPLLSLQRPSGVQR